MAPFLAGAAAGAGVLEVDECEVDECAWALLGAVELLKTDCPPCWRVTPAVPPRTRVARSAWPLLPTETAGAVLGAGCRPLPAGPPERPVAFLVAPLVPPLVAPLVVPDAVECTALPAEAPAELPADPGAAAEAGGADGGATAGAATAAPEGGAGGGVGGAGGDDGVPKPGLVQAQAMLAPTTAVASTDNTATASKRVRLSIHTTPLSKVLSLALATVARSRCGMRIVFRRWAERRAHAAPRSSLIAVTGFAARRSAPIALLAVVLLAVAAPEPAAGAGASTAKVVRLPFPRYDGTLTPYTFDLGYPLVTLVYDTLTWRDADGIPQPWLARAVIRSRGGRRVTVRLRPGVRWQDGRPLTAADVAFSFGFVARRFQPRFTPQLADVEQVRATGPLTATFDLRRPSLGFDDQPLADVPILPRHLWQGLPADRTAPRGPAVGSGPYRIVTATRKQGYVLRANRRYFRGAPRVEEIRVPIIDDAERTFQALRDRRVDMVPLSLPGQTAQDFGSTLGIGVLRGPSYSGTALLLNLRRPPFDRPDVRRAVAASLDLGRMVRNVAPAVAAVEGQIHPASRWSAGVPLQRSDVRAARRTLAQAGRRPIRVLAPTNDPVRLEAGRQVVLALRRAGAEADLVKLARGRLGHAIGEDGAAPDFDAAIQSIPALASEDPDYLAKVFGSRARNAPLNFSGYHSQAFDALARRVASVPGSRARREATRAELRLLAHDLPSIPLFFSGGAFAYRPEVYDGWGFIKGTGILDKRSFLPSTGPTREAPAGAPRVDAPAASGSGLGVVDVIAIAVLAGVGLLVVVALVQRRSAGRR